VRQPTPEEHAQIQELLEATRRGMLPLYTSTRHKYSKYVSRLDEGADEDIVGKNAHRTTRLE
jgi:hypothetical protein